MPTKANEFAGEWLESCNQKHPLNKELMILESYTVICINLQPVVPPARMEEHVMVHHPLLTATVPVGTQETTARTEVCIAAHTTMQHGGQLVHDAYMYVCTYVQ